MPAFFLAFISVLAATLAGREALRVARLSGAGVPQSGLLVAAAIAAVIFATLSAVIGDQMAPLLNPKGTQLITAIALALAGCEVLFLQARKAPKEPTLSVGAVTLVLGGALLTGAAGLLTMAIALVTGVPILAGAGSAFGAFVALAVPTLAGAAWEDRWPRVAMRRTIGGLLLLAALLTGLPVFVPIF